MFFTAHKALQMQGMDKKYDGHAWCMVITINIKNSFGFCCRKDRCLGHLHCAQYDYESSVCTTSRNETSSVVKAHIF